MIRKAYVEVRSQHAKGSSNHSGFGGPDTYVAVQIVPKGVEPLQTLRHDIAAKRGIVIEWIGEGYSLHSGPRSALGRAKAAAQRRADAINGVRQEQSA